MYDTSNNNVIKIKKIYGAMAVTHALFQMSKLSHS